MAYPDNVYPTAAGFPTIDENFVVDADLYGVMVDYLQELNDDLAAIIDEDGNIDLATGKAIKWDGTSRITRLVNNAVIATMDITGDFYISGDVTGATLLSIAGTLQVDDHLDLSGSLSYGGSIGFDYVRRTEHKVTWTSEPGDPANDEAVIWMSDATGYGGLKDLCIKITEGGSTKSITLVDYTSYS